MPRFVFDTNLLINYIRYNESEAHDALMAAASLGTIFISKVSIWEMWAPEKWKIKEESPNSVPLWKRKLDEEEIPKGMLEVLVEQLDRHQQPIPNRFIPRTLREGRLWAISDENDQLVSLVEYVDNAISIRSPDIRKSQVEQEISELKNICNELGAQIVPLSARAQDYAEIIIQYYRDTLGKSVITDSLVIATGLDRRAWLVTADTDWERVAQDVQNRGLPLPKMKVIDPVQLSQKGVP